MTKPALYLVAAPHRALKTKHETPKYGLIYHASLIGQSQPKYKGKISRVLAAKCALAIRVDALGDTTDASVGLEAREKVSNVASTVLMLSLTCCQPVCVLAASLGSVLGMMPAPVLACAGWLS